MSPCCPVAVNFHKKATCVKVLRSKLNVFFYHKKVIYLQSFKRNNINFFRCYASFLQSYCKFAHDGYKMNIPS